MTKIETMTNGEDGGKKLKGMALSHALFHYISKWS